MADLSDLFRVAPIMASSYVGENQALDTQTTQAKNAQLAQILADLQQKHQQQDQLFPAELQSKQLANQLMSQGTIPETLQKLRGSTMTNDATQATQAGSIAATNATNAGTVDTANIAAHDRFTQFLMKMGPELSGVQPLERMSYLTNAMKQAKFDPQSPQAQAWLQLLSQKDPTTWPKEFSDMSTQLGQQAANQNPAYLGTVQGAKIHGEYGVKEHQIAAGASNYAADRAADSRIEVGAAKNEVTMEKIRMSQNIQARIVELQKQPPSAERDAAIAQLTQIAQQISPQVGTAIDLSALQNGKLQRQGDRPVAVPKTGTTASGAKFRVIETP